MGAEDVDGPWVVLDGDGVLAAACAHRCCSGDIVDEGRRRGERTSRKEGAERREGVAEWWDGGAARKGESSGTEGMDVGGGRDAWETGASTI